MGLDEDEEIEKLEEKKKWHNLRDLASQCFFLSLLMLVCFGLTTFILIICCCVVFGSEDSTGGDPDILSGDASSAKEHAIILLCKEILCVQVTLKNPIYDIIKLTINETGLTIMSIIATIVSFLLMMATASVRNN
jgi:hypothetical protein